MSRSIHQTLKSVFFKKSKREVDEMCDESNLDPDVIELRKKYKYRENEIQKRKEKKNNCSEEF